MENSNTIEQPSISQSARERWLFILVISIVLNVAGLFLFPQFLTDGLTLRLTLVCGLPALWDCYAVLFFRTRRERIVGYVSIVPAVAWLVAIVDLLSTFGWAGV